MSPGLHACGTAELTARYRRRRTKAVLEEQRRRHDEMQAGSSLRGADTWAVPSSGPARLPSEDEWGPPLQSDADASVSRMGTSPPISQPMRAAPSYARAARTASTPTAVDEPGGARASAPDSTRSSSTPSWSNVAAGRAAAMRAPSDPGDTGIDAVAARSTGADGGGGNSSSSGKKSRSKTVLLSTGSLRRY